MAEMEELAEENKFLEKQKVSKKQAAESSDSESDDERIETKMNALNQNHKIESISNNQKKLYKNLNTYG